MKLLVEENELTGIADAIREKTGKSDSLEFPDDFIDEIENIITTEGTPETWTITLVDGTVITKDVIVE